MKYRFTGNRRLPHSLLVVIGLTFLCVLTKRSEADLIRGESQGYGMQVDLQLGIVSANLLNATPGQISTGIAPQSYSTSGSALAAGLNFGSTISVPPLTTVQLNLATIDGALSSTAASGVDGSAGPKLTTASGLTNGLSLGIGNAAVTTLGVTTNIPLLTIQADSIGSTSEVFGDYADFSTNGLAVIQNLSISVANLQLSVLDLVGANGSIDAQGFLTVAPNTQILNLGGVAGLNLTLNEQITTGDGVNTRGFETNALRFSFNNVSLAGVPLTGTISGDVEIGHAYSAALGTISAVPEPGSLAAIAMIGGLVFTGGKLRSRKKRGENQEPVTT